MKEIDKAEFVSTLNLCYATLLKPLPSVDALNLWFKLLEPFSIGQVKDALAIHMLESKFPPVPADVVQRIPKQSDGRPDAEEAWAISRNAIDENETIVWTQECASAFASAESLLQNGDDVGARMAFKSAYNRLVEQARAQGTPTHWFSSNGRDAQRREYVIAQAVRDGKLALAHAKTIVPGVLEDLREERALLEVQKLTSKLTGRLPS